MKEKVRQFQRWLRLYLSIWSRCVASNFPALRIMHGRQLNIKCRVDAVEIWRNETDARQSHAGVFAVHSFNSSCLPFINLQTKKVLIYSKRPTTLGISNWLTSFGFLFFIFILNSLTKSFLNRLSYLRYASNCGDCPPLPPAIPSAGIVLPSSSSSPSKSFFS